MAVHRTTEAPGDWARRNLTRQLTGPDLPYYECGCPAELPGVWDVGRADLQGQPRPFLLTWWRVPFGARCRIPHCFHFGEKCTGLLNEAPSLFQCRHEVAQGFFS